MQPPEASSEAAGTETHDAGPCCSLHHSTLRPSHRDQSSPATQPTGSQTMVGAARLPSGPSATSSTHGIPRSSAHTNIVSPPAPGCRTCVIGRENTVSSEYLMRAWIAAAPTDCTMMIETSSNPPAAQENGSGSEEFVAANARSAVGLAGGSSITSAAVKKPRVSRTGSPPAVGGSAVEYVSSYAVLGSSWAATRIVRCRLGGPYWLVRGAAGDTVTGTKTPPGPTSWGSRSSPTPGGPRPLIENQKTACVGIQRSTGLRSSACSSAGEHASATRGPNAPAAATAAKTTRRAKPSIRNMVPRPPMPSYLKPSPARATCALRLRTPHRASLPTGCARPTARARAPWRFRAGRGCLRVARRT